MRKKKSHRPHSLAILALWQMVIRAVQHFQLFHSLLRQVHWTQWCNTMHRLQSHLLRLPSASAAISTGRWLLNAAANGRRRCMIHNTTKQTGALQISKICGG